jgi:hypothetical protein
MYKKVIGAQGSEITLLPGYYWARWKDGRRWEPWLIVEVVEVENYQENYTDLYICGDDTDRLFEEFKDWYGPLVCPFD